MDLTTAVNTMTSERITAQTSTTSSPPPPAANSPGGGNNNSNNNNNNASVACPVCTLYLREGISLQKHLDTHPKEQVIEALIRASSNGTGPSPTFASQLFPTPAVIPTTSSLPITGRQSPSTSQSPHVTTCPPQTTQSQYPIGPIYECPPQINAMIPPPQFASFSYQQFVNNGTMMIPTQYAMAQAQAAPTSQMMQMLYSPYGMYHQQQIPTVQVISPTSMLPTSSSTLSSPQSPTTAPAITERIRSSASVSTTIASISNEVIAVPASTPLTIATTTSLQPLKLTTTVRESTNSLQVQSTSQQLMEIDVLKDEPPIERVAKDKILPSVENITTEIDLFESNSPDIVQIEQEEEQCNNKIHAECTEKQIQVASDDIRKEQSHIAQQCQRQEPTTLASKINRDNTEFVKTERVLPIIEGTTEIESHINRQTEVAVSPKNSELMEVTQTFELVQNFASNKVDLKESTKIKYNVPDNDVKSCKKDDDVEIIKEIIKSQNLSTNVEESQSSVAENSKLDQINRLLGNMESEIGNIDLTKQKVTEESDFAEQDVPMLTDLIDKREDEDETTNNTIYHKTMHKPIECKIIVSHEESDVSSVASSSISLGCDREIQKIVSYGYKLSKSAPTSPICKKEIYRSLSRPSIRSDICRSNDNIFPYPVGFEAITLQKFFLKDNYNDEEMELEDRLNKSETHHTYLKQKNNSKLKQSNSITTLSAGGCVGDEMKPSHSNDRASMVSVHSVSSYCQMEEEDDDDDEEDEEEDEEEYDSDKDEEEDDEEEEEEEEDDDDDEEEEEEDDENIALLETPRAMMAHDKTKMTKKEACKASSINNLTNQPQQQQAVDFRTQSLIAGRYSPNQFPIQEQQSTASNYDKVYPLLNSNTSQNLLNMPEFVDPITSTDSKSFNSNSTKSIVQKPSVEVLNINEDAHAGPINVFEFDGLQVLVPSTFISDSSQKAVSATSQQSMSSSENGTGNDEEVKSVNMRADETMPAKGELSEQESNGCTEQSAWQLYMGHDSSRMSTSYDLMARESWEESEGSDHEENNGGSLLDSRSLATHFTSSLFLDRDRKTPTRRIFKCSHCPEVFDCPKERRVHSTLVHKEAGPSSCSNDNVEQSDMKEIKLLDGRNNVFDNIFVPNSLNVTQQQTYQQQSPLLHQLQPPQQQRPSSTKTEADFKNTNVLHLSTVTEVTCNLCNQRFSSEKSLQIHHRRMHVTEPVKRIREKAKCLICQEEFTSVASFNLHLKIHPLECRQCGKYFYRKQNFKLHMRRHLGIKPFSCTHCDKAFLTKQKLDEHTNGHTGNAPVKCNLCNETFRRYSNLTQHKNRHHLNIKKKSKDYICHCGEVFHTKKKLAWHKETHDDKPKSCTYCNERFIHMASLTRHMRRAHNRRFVPDAQRENENVECPICKCIYLRSSLAVHMRVHNGERPYVCQVCSKTFSTKWNLQLHKWTHAARSTKPFKCNQCSAAFYRHSDYTAHMNSHRNVRPYTCNYCGAQFIRKYNCLRHVKEHEENKQYTCEICSKTFHRSYYLKEHLRVHSGQRPYTCHICGKSSSTKSNHNKHVRIHHAREPVNTEN